ncbi:MAG TPA: 1-(5-phosphoribosyl)-5-[(5-phosphoribosylamino)methylideneamino] imidazole-4-carboxamide isomerase [Bacteroidetes bacterium]|nr:1-(5-phosphoribosyl)-5-[(5-phosphoribosylamino)methylideneamino] imidazole-4-carboxamide isomerase [Bacteroidota bacterium]
MIELFPAIDLIGGKVVRLREGAFDRKTEYAEDPLLLAKRYAAQGFRNLHLVDLDGARSGKPQHLDVLKAVTHNTSLRVDFGGGLRSEEAIEQAFAAGVWKINIGSVAIKKPALLRHWMMTFGQERFIAAVDVKNGKPATNGWQEEAETTWQETIKSLADMGIVYLSVTAILRDGNMQGADLALYRQIRKAFPTLRLIASGGISSVDEIEELEKIGVWGVILGKALLEGQIKSENLEKFL